MASTADAHGDVFAFAVGQGIVGFGFWLEDGAAESAAAWTASAAEGWGSTASRRAGMGA